MLKTALTRCQALSSAMAVERSGEGPLHGNQTVNYSVKQNVKPLEGTL